MLGAMVAASREAGFRQPALVLPRCDEVATTSRPRDQTQCPCKHGPTATQERVNHNCPIQAVELVHHDDRPPFGRRVSRSSFARAPDSWLTATLQQCNWARAKANGRIRRRMSARCRQPCRMERPGPESR